MKIGSKKGGFDKKVKEMREETKKTSGRRVCQAEERVRAKALRQERTSCAGR